MKQQTKELIYHLMKSLNLKMIVSNNNVVTEWVWNYKLDKPIKV